MNLLIVTQKVDQNDQLLGFFIGWLKRLAGKFENVLVICLEKGQFDLPENVRVISLGKENHLSKPVWLFNFYQYIFRYQKEYDAVLVHMNPIWTILGGWFWRLMRKKIFLWYTSGGVTAKLKLAEKLSHIVLTASKESFRLPSHKVVVIGHGVDTELFKPSLNSQAPASINESIKVLSIGRIAPIKNYETLIGAAKVLRDQGVSFSVTMIGEAVLARDKEYEKKLKLKIDNLNLQKYFNFIGKINNQKLVPFYQNHDIFVHLSKTGSLDKVLLEAMATGMAVLSSNESSGFLPPELIFKENDPSELADKIKKMRNSPHTHALREYVVTNHNLDNLIEKIAIVIKNEKSN